jgi:hypothetical protein
VPNERSAQRKKSTTPVAAPQPTSDRITKQRDRNNLPHGGGRPRPIASGL